MNEGVEEIGKEIQLWRKKRSEREPIVFRMENSASLPMFSTSMC
jgi:hypothetical protein